MNTDSTLTATQARAYALRISNECSQSFSTVKAVKRFGRWQIDINGGSAACYGRTLTSEESAEDTLRVFKND